LLLSLWDNSGTLRARLQRHSRIAPLLAILLALAAWTQAAAQQRGRLVGVIGIPREIAPVEARLESATVTRIQGIVFTSGVIEGNRIVTVRSGVGKVNAAMAATLLIDHFAPSAVIFTGTAGAIDPELTPGDVVIGTAVGYHDYGSFTANAFIRSPTGNAASGQADPALFPADPQLLGAARRAAGIVRLSGSGLKTDATPRIREGVIVTGDAFVSSPSRRIELRRELKASAVEMEGAAVVQVCARFGVPVIVIRSITDHAEGDASGSYQRYVDDASRNAASLAIATIHELTHQ
jgi:adenosylhomocysteine nucleosidase